MGNLLACFGPPKEGERRKPSMPEQQVGERHRSLRMSPAANVPAQWMVPECKSTGQCVRYECEKKSFNEANGHFSTDDEDPKQPVSDSPKKAVTSSPKKKVTFDMNVQMYESDTVHPSVTEDVEDRDEVTKKEDEQEKKPGDLMFPSDHRYQNCMISDDDDSEDDADELYDVGEEDDGECDDLIQEMEEEEESFSSYFSMRLERGHQECGDEPHLSASERARDRSSYVHPVLNPVENLSQWKEVKGGKVAPNKLKMKENIGEVKEAKVPTSPSKSNSCPDEQEVLLDASLASWLTPPHRIKTSQEDCYYSRSNTSTSLDDRPILGALIVDDLKRANTLSTSPRKSPSRSPDGTPIVGTVGRCWNHTSLDSTTKGIPNTTSKYSEDKRVKWHSTPFEVRLERALSKESVDVTDIVANTDPSPFEMRLERALSKGSVDVTDIIANADPSPAVF